MNRDKKRYRNSSYICIINIIIIKPPIFTNTKTVLHKCEFWRGSIINKIITSKLFKIVNIIFLSNVFCIYSKSHDASIKAARKYSCFKMNNESFFFLKSLHIPICYIFPCCLHGVFHHVPCGFLLMIWFC